MKSLINKLRPTRTEVKIQAQGKNRDFTDNKKKERKQKTGKLTELLERNEKTKNQEELKVTTN